MRYKCRGMSTVAFVMRRLLGAIPTLALIVALSFLLTRLAPGGPFDEEQSLPPEIRANLEAAYGLDQPVYVQFGRYVRACCTAISRPSYKFRDFTVSELIADGLPVSLTIGFAALLLALVIGIPAGILAALNRGGIAGPAVMTLAVAGISVPVFVSAPLLMLVFGIWLRWLPVAGLDAGTACGPRSCRSSRSRYRSSHISRARRAAASLRPCAPPGSARHARGACRNGP